MQQSSDEIIQFGKTCLEVELSSLNQLSERIDNTFASAVKCILEHNGRVVITGIGKSAIIAQKIVATLNSTGTPSLFMHAADAIHGDLGMIQKNDVVIAISKSGTTPEIKSLVPLLKQFGNPLIAIVGNTQSALALSSDIVLDTSVQMEACPNNLAPTTSTTAQLMMGDALAVALLQCKKFSKNDFSKVHPGGALGKQLYLTVKDIADHNLKPQVTANAGIKEVIINMTKNRMGATAVCDNHQVIGIITDGDIRRMIENTLHFEHITAADIMSKHPKTIEDTTMASQAAIQMTQEKISQLIVLHQGNYAGMIHIHDLTKEGLL